MSPLTEWADFYVITGTAAATLTGLMFVVLTLIVGTLGRRSNTGLGVYSTPTVVHLGATLVVTVLLSAPWPALWQAGLALGVFGLVGLAYSIVVTRRAIVGTRVGDYRPVLEDWLCHTILPVVGYAALLVAAFILPRDPTLALFDAGAVIALFLILGIHNAWDIVTYVIGTPGLAGAESSDAPPRTTPDPPNTAGERAAGTGAASHNSDGGSRG